MKIARFTKDGKLETFDGVNFTRCPKPKNVKKSDFDCIVEGNDATPLEELFKSAKLEAEKDEGTKGVPDAKELAEIAKEAEAAASE